MKTKTPFNFSSASLDLFPEVPHLTSSHPDAIPLRDQIRQARKFGVSMECLPLPVAYDEDEYVIDPNADLRVSRFDRADIMASQSKRNTPSVDAQLTAAGQSLMDPISNTAPQTSPTGQSTPEGSTSTSA